MSKSLGQVAYEAYFEYSKGKSLISGAPLPTFQAQSLEVRGAWEEAARAVVAVFDPRVPQTPKQSEHV